MPTTPATRVLWTPGQPLPAVPLHPPPQPLPSRHQWALARDILASCLSELSGVPVQIGRVSKLGGGLFRTAEMAEVVVPGARPTTYVVLLPIGDVEGHPSCLREAALLHTLGGLTLPFVVPRVVAVYEAWGHSIIEEFCPGVPLEGHWAPPDALELTAQTAAAIHTLDVSPFATMTDGFDTWQEHAQHEFDNVYQARPELQPVHDWMRQHLPPPRPSVLLHGDLLGHNLLRDLDANNQLAVIDWQLAHRGDPASDLAVVTRGVKQPFKRANGLATLLDAYHQAGGPAVTANQVRFYELCMHLRWYEGSLSHEPGQEPSDAALQRIQAILRRCQHEAGS